MTTRMDILKYVAHMKILCDVDPIYEILVFEKPNSSALLKNGRETGFPDMGCKNHVGYVLDIDEAIKIFENNIADIWETCYNAGFILCRFPGLYNCVVENARMYFVFDKEKKGYVQKEEPEVFDIIAL